VDVAHRGVGLELGRVLVRRHRDLLGQRGSQIDLQFQGNGRADLHLLIDGLEPGDLDLKKVRIERNVAECKASLGAGRRFGEETGEGIAQVHHDARLALSVRAGEASVDRADIASRSRRGSELGEKQYPSEQPGINDSLAIRGHKETSVTRSGHTENESLCVNARPRRNDALCTSRRCRSADEQSLSAAIPCVRARLGIRAYRTDEEGGAREERVLKKSRLTG